MGNLKPVPADADSIQSFRDYLDLCEKNSPPGFDFFDPEKMVIANRLFGDGKWQILYNDPDFDFFCSSEIDWENRDLSVKSGKLSDANPQTLGVLEIEDACTSTKALAGEEEFQGRKCRDKGGDPALLKGKDTFTVNNFSSGCMESLSKYGLNRYGKDLGSAFNLERALLTNENPEDGFFKLQFQSKKYDFFCDGLVDSSSHFMYLASGSLGERDSKSPDKAIELNDACSSTTLLLGAKELVGECKDRTKKERNLEHYLTIGFYGVTSYLAYKQMYKWGKRFWTSRIGTGVRKLPVVRYSGSGYLAGQLFNATSGIFLNDDHPVRKYGTYVAGGAGMVAPEILQRTLAKRLSSTSLLARAGGFWTKVGSRALLIGLADMGFGAIFNDYEKSVHKRVADRYYDQHIYKFSGWDLLIVPLLYKGASIISRFVAPNLNDWATTVGNSEMVEKVLAEDREACGESLAFIREIFQSVKSDDPATDRQLLRHLLDSLKTPVTLSEEDWRHITTLEGLGRKPGEDPNDQVKSLMDQLPRRLSLIQFGSKESREMANWDPGKVDELFHKLMIFKMQQGAKFMVAVKQDNDLNHWAREVFNPDGTLKEDMEKGFWNRIQQETPEYLRQELEQKE